MDNTSKKLFKKSFMGGFKREDVANYIAEKAMENERSLDALKSEIKVSEAERVKLYNANMQLDSEKKDLLSRIDDLSVKVSEGDAAKAELAALKEDYALLKADKENLVSEIATLKNELSVKDAKIAQFEAKEEELSRNKEQIANLELEARNRAKQIEEDARSRMAAENSEHKAYIENENQKLVQYRNKTYAEVEELVSKMSASYDGTKNAVYDFKTGFKAVVTELAREIDTISDASLNIEEAFNALKTNCENMREGK